jgi:hypothetical protein
MLNSFKKKEGIVLWIEKQFAEKLFGAAAALSFSSNPATHQQNRKKEIKFSTKPVQVEIGSQMLRDFSASINEGLLTVTRTTFF